MHIIKNRNVYYLLPAALIVLSLVAVLVFGLKGGVDLTGGSLLEVSYEGGRPSQEEVVASVNRLALGEIRVQEIGGSNYLLRMRDISDGDKNALLMALNIHGSEPKEEQFTTIGPTIGKELRTKAWYAMALVLLAIIAYIAFAFRKVSEPVQSWKYGVIAIVTLVHDIILPIGLFAFLGYTHGAEVDSLFIVGLLTILGISINDTIVVFDRIRENLKVNIEKGRKEDFEVTVGHSITQTVARSINTSLTVIIVLVALYFMGPETTKNFALTLIVGMAAGTYSSIFLASPLLVTWERFSKRSA
jgi:preprotein translocase subunit SecF